MKKKISIFSLLLLVTMLFGCTMGNTPKAKVETLLNRYQSKDNSIVGELDDYLKTLTIDDKNYDDYKNVYLKQYENMKYVIKDEKIDGDNATVVAQIDVYDYYAYAAVPRQQLAHILAKLDGEKIKGKKTRFEAVR